MQTIVFSFIQRRFCKCFDNPKFFAVYIGYFLMLRLIRYRIGNTIQ